MSLSLALAMAMGACSDETAAVQPDGRVIIGDPFDAPTSDGPRPDAPTGPTSGWRVLALPDDAAEARVTGVYCTSVDDCVIGTQAFAESGKIYAAGAGGVGSVVLDGEDVVDTASILGTIGFLGFRPPPPRRCPRASRTSTPPTARCATPTSAPRRRRWRRRTSSSARTWPWPCSPPPV